MYSWNPYEPKACYYFSTSPKYRHSLRVDDSTTYNIYLFRLPAIFIRDYHKNIWSPLLSVLGAPQTPSNELITVPFREDAGVAWGPPPTDHTILNHLRDANARWIPEIWYIVRGHEGWYNIKKRKETKTCTRKIVAGPQLSGRQLLRYRGVYKRNLKSAEVVWSVTDDVVQHSKESSLGNPWSY